MTSQSVYASASRVGNYEPLWDVEVLRNVTIQRTAEGLKEIDRLYKARRYLEAWQLADKLERDLRNVARLTNEDQMYKDADLMRKYKDTLSRWVQNQTGRPPQPSSDNEYPQQPSRGREPTPVAPVLDVR